MQYIFTTTDCGETIRPHKLEFTPKSIVFDERVNDIFLIHDLKSDQKSLHVTKNYGETFSPVSDYVKAFFLKSQSDHTKIYIQRFQPSKIDNPTNEDSKEAEEKIDFKCDKNCLTTILASRNYFERHIDVEILYQDAIDFQMHGDYMFVTSKSQDTEKGKDHLELKLSAHGLSLIHI